MTMKAMNNVDAAEKRSIDHKTLLAKKNLDKLITQYEEWCLDHLMGLTIEMITHLWEETSQNILKFAVANRMKRSGASCSSSYLNISITMSLPLPDLHTDCGSCTTRHLKLILVLM